MSNSTKAQRAGLALVLVAAAVAAAGCGGDDPADATAKVATARGGSGAGGPLPSTSLTTSSGLKGGSGHVDHLVMRGGEGATKFSACMRKNGVPDFPDPNADGSISIDSGNGVDPSTATFKDATSTCQHLMPKAPPPTAAESEKIRAQGLKFSACMRDHGLKGFPDPTSAGGGIKLTVHAGSGLDPSSPQFQRAQTACAKLMPNAPGSGGSSLPSGR